MKKTLVSALTTALVVGAASTTFAAANPFSDVPADHWAYDAVSQLAADGVIEGYGDSTFKGNRNITRYEMAQMVAKAMAKSTSGADKALVDKLAAEFAEELNNLGVRVANLERNADMVKWNGKAEYTFQTTNLEGIADRNNTNNVLFRLEPSAEVNSNWHVKARLDATNNMANDSKYAAAGNIDSNMKVELKRIWAQGDYENVQVKVGKFADTIANDVVFDDVFSGIGVTFGKDLKATVNYGRLNARTTNDVLTNAVGTNETGNYWGIGLKYDAGSKWSARAGYQHFGLGDTIVPANVDAINVWSLGAGYKFDKNVALDAVYAHGNNDFNNAAQNSAYAFTLNYKGAEAANKGSWGAWVGYRYLGAAAAVHPTYDVINPGQKGWELGVKYVPLKNVVAQLQYGRGTNNMTGAPAAVFGTPSGNFSSLFGRVEFLF